MLKKITALFLICSILLSTINFVAAGTESPAEKLNTLGLLLNISQPELKKELTRDVGVTMILKSLGYEEADATAAIKDTPFKDVEGWAKGWVALAFKLGITNGVTTTKFDPNGKLPEVQFVTFQLRALGYQINSLENTPGLAIVVGLAQSGDDLSAKTYTKGDASEVMFRALSAKVQGASDMMLIDKLIAEKVANVTVDTAVLVGLKQPVPVELAVKDVSIINSCQISITFNNNVDKIKAENVDNYDVYLQSAFSTDIFTTISAGSKAVLQPDNKTVILTIKTGSIFNNYSVTNKVVIKPGVGLSSSYTNTALPFSDTTIPTLVSATSNGYNEVTLTFSEPVKSVGSAANIFINDGSIAVNMGSTVYSISDRSLTFTSYANLVPGTTYTLKINTGNNITDYVGYGIVPSTTSFLYNPVVSAPTYTLKESTESTATIVFSTPIKAETIVGNTKLLITHTYNTATNQVNGLLVTNPSSDNKTFVIDFGAKVFPPGTITMFMKYADGTVDSAKIKDAFGNSVSLYNLTVSTIPDLIAPSVDIEIETGSNTIINISFSEAILPSALVSSNFVLKQGSSTVGFSGPMIVSGNKYKLVTSNPMSGNYTLEIKNIKDNSISQNALPKVTYNLSVSDSIKPYITTENGVTPSSNFYTQSDTKNVRIYFNEIMDLNTLQDLSKYQNSSDGSANPLSTTPGVDGKSVHLVFQNPVAGNVLVGTVKDASGNLLSGLSATLIASVGTPVGLLTPTSSVPNPVLADSPTTVKIYLNDLVQNVSVADFQVYTGSSWVYPATYVIDTINGKSVITLVVPSDNAFTMDALDVSVRTVNSGIVGITGYARNLFSKGVYFAATTVVDKIAPSIDKITFISATQIQVKFKENLNPSTMAAVGVNGFSVSGGVLTSAIKSLSVHNVIILTGTGFSIDTDVYYSGSNGIADANGNSLNMINQTLPLNDGI